MRRAWILVLVGCTAIRPLDPGIDGGPIDAGSGDGAVRDAPATDARCSMPDLCNGMDDDCTAATADGSGDPRVGAPCDGPDADVCEEGTGSCNAGNFQCSDFTADNLEACDGGIVDDDCDGMIDEDGALGSIMAYPDADMDGFGDISMGRMMCEVPFDWIQRGRDCDDTDPLAHPNVAERCNARDDDCDGLVDDNVRCGNCDSSFMYNGHTYWICSPVRTWDQAQMECTSFGYQLVVIEDMAENAEVAMRTSSMGALAGYWIGLRDVGAAEFRWVNATPLTYMNWESGEPNGTGQCARIRSMILFNGTWGDYGCTTTAPYICETR